MPLAMPKSGLLNQQLGKFGLAAKASQTLFSPMQAPAAVAPERTSMQYDRYATSLSPMKMTDLSAPNFGWGSQAEPPSLVGGLGQNQSPNFSGSPVSNVGGDWSGVEQWSGAINAAAQQYGVDPNLIKAIMKLESNGDPNASGASGVWGPMQVNAGAWGYGPWMTDPTANIMKGAEILKTYLDENGGDVREALRHYHGIGSDGYTTDQSYADIVLGNYNQLQSGAGTNANGAVAPIDGMWGGNPVGNAFVDQALKFQGVNYVWGSIPGAGQDPWKTGWDCSGFTYYMNQSYGDKDLPMGSHYQYQYAQQNGRLFTDLSQLQPGDLVFINTGWQGGAGAELNQAGHVGIYIGNGQMIHAANPSTGTIVSPLSGYGNIMGGMHQMGASGGGGVSSGYHGSGGNPVTGYTSPSAAMSWQEKFRRFMEGQ